MNLEHSFENPQNEYRGVPFWSWNDKLEKDELLRQIDEMLRAGMGGFIIHSRTGLLTEYMSDEWMDLTKACVDRAKELGMLAWLYDEDRWPSGFAGGAVPGMKPANRMKLIIWCPADTVIPDGEGGVLAVYSATKSDDGAFVDWQLESDTTQKPGRELFRFDWRYQPKSDWCNGESYLDTLSESAVHDFIHYTYDAYADAVGDEFGKTVPGVFTDEPQYYMSNPEMGNTFRGVPYTEEMPAVFEAMSGYELTEALPALFFKVPGGEALRYDYRLCATRMFADNFTKQIGQWCDDHHCDMTGHFMAEDDFSSQIYAIGAAMPHYEYMQSPGIDLICRRQSDPLLPRQTSSAARQFGRRRILAESFGGSGWNLSFKEQKWIADWLFVHGVTYMNQHLAYYSAWGGRKRDWPPSIHYQQPWWPHYPTMANYMARVNLIARSGDVRNDILVLHTISSGWATWTPDDQTACANYSQSMVNVSQWLGQMQRDHDYGDEILLARYGDVKDGCFWVNKAAYKLVILPPSLTLAHSTVELLKVWLKSGGKLLSVGEQPTMVDGRPAELSELWTHANCIHVECSQDSIQDTVKMLIDEPVSVTQDGHFCDTIHVRQTKLDDGRIATYLINRSLDKDVGMADVSLPGNGELTQWNLDTGVVEPVNYDYHDGAFHLTLPFGIVQSHMLVIDNTKQPQTTKAKCLSQRIMTLSTEPQVKLMQPNALPLDYAKLTIPGVLTTPLKPVIFCTEDVAAHLGISADLNNGGISLWKINKERKAPAKELDIELEYRVDCEIDLQNAPVSLLVEKPDTSSICINGQPVEMCDEGWWLDIGFRKIPVTGMLKHGTNVIVQKMHFTEGLTLEPLMLLGEFGVELRDDNQRALITAAPKQLSLQDWTTQGLPFYNGSVQYCWNIDIDSLAECMVLKLDAYDAALAAVSVNGVAVGDLPWAPYELDITKHIKQGANTISVELYSSPRNLLGPLHNRAGEVFAASPQYFSSHHDWVDRYQLGPYALHTPPQLIISQ